jgi:hypothetical protein
MATVLGVAGLVFWSFSVAEQPEEAARPPATSTTSPSRSSAEVERTAPSPATTAVEVAAGEPLLGEPVGVSVLLPDSGNLRRLDLDTGRSTTYDTSGQPLFASGEWLVLTSPAGMLARSVPIADPAAEGVVLDVGSHYWQRSDVRPGPEPGQAWMLSRGSAPVWQLVNLEDGTMLDEQPGAVMSVGLSPSDPSVATSLAGGVFAFDGQQYEKVFDGTLVAVSDDHVLAQACTQPLECELHWLDRSTWDPIERPVPDADIAWGGWLSPGGRILGYPTAAGDEIAFNLFDVEQGMPVDLAVDGYLEQPAFSPDGRLMAFITDGSAVTLYDIETGQVHQLAEIGPGSWPLVFVESTR